MNPTPQTESTELNLQPSDCTIAQFIIGSKEHEKYVRLNHKQFKMVMDAYVDTDLIENESFQTILVVVFEDKSELYHILSSPDDN